MPDLSELSFNPVFCEFFKNLFSGSSVKPHTFLFSGPNNSGKEFAAFKIMQAFNAHSDNLEREELSNRKLETALSPDLHLFLTRFDKEFFFHVLGFYLKHPSLSKAEFLLKREMQKILVLLSQNEKLTGASKQLFETLKDFQSFSSTHVLSPKQAKEITALIEKSRFSFNVSISYARSILEKLYLGNSELKYKILLINDVADLSVEVSNILLKSIEEPPENLIIFLLSRNYSNILPTIRSRAVHLHFKPYSVQQKKQINEKIPGLNLILPERDFSINSFFEDAEDLDKQNLNKALDFLKKDLSFLSELDADKLEYLNHLKYGLNYLNLSPALVKRALAIIYKRMNEAKQKIN